MDDSTKMDHNNNFRGFERHVVLVAPEVHWNTGNIGRTCLGVGALLHLVEPIGFSMDCRQVKRAGLDYWSDVKLQIWKTFDEFKDHLKPLDKEMILFAKAGKNLFWEMPHLERMILVFGSESIGLPKSIFEKYYDVTYFIPVSEHIRSLNLSTAVGIALYESLRKRNLFHAWS